MPAIKTLGELATLASITVDDLKDFKEADFEELTKDLGIHVTAKVKLRGLHRKLLESCAEGGGGVAMREQSMLSAAQFSHEDETLRRPTAEARLSVPTTQQLQRQAAAATCIQAAFRAHEARKALCIFRDTIKSIVKVQALWRGVHVRQQMPLTQDAATAPAAAPAVAPAPTDPAPAPTTDPAAEMLLALETTVLCKLQEYDHDGLVQLQLLGEEDGFRGLAEQMLGQGGNSHDSEERLQACARMIGERLDVLIANRQCEECASNLITHP